MAARGRKPLEDELRLRERIESLFLAGLRPSGIRDALASSQNTAPIELSLRQVQAHVAVVRRGWAQSCDPAEREAERAELVAALKEVVRVAAASSARYREEALGVGYLNSEIRAIDRLSKLLALDVRLSSEPEGSADASGSPFAGQSAAEQAASLRHLAELVDDGT